MKYTLIINQKQAIELGITNINQAHIFDLLTSCSTWANHVMINDKVYYWVSRSVISSELPLLKIKNDTVYRHLKELDKKGLIDYKKDGVKDLIKLTKKGNSYHSDANIHYVGNKSENSKNTMSEINPSKLGNKSESNSEINPTYHTTKIHHTTNDKDIRKNKRFKKPNHEEIKEYLKTKQQQIDVDYFIDYYESKDWMIGKNKMKNWKSAINNWLRNNKKFEEQKNATHIKRRLTPAELDEQRDQWYRDKYAD